MNTICTSCMKSELTIAVPAVETNLKISSGFFKLKLCCSYHTLTVCLTSTNCTLTSYPDLMFCLIQANFVWAYLPNVCLKSSWIYCNYAVLKSFELIGRRWRYLYCYSNCYFYCSSSDLFYSSCYFCYCSSSR